MDYIHIVNGDSAGDILQRALARAGRAERVVVLRDDLAVGPVRDIDDGTQARSDFWQRVMPGAGIDFPAELSHELATLHALATCRDEVVVWHGDSSADQLTLRRFAFHLRNSPARLNEIRVDAVDLDDPHIQAGDRVAMGMVPDHIVTARLTAIAPISLLRIGRLALEWRALKREHAQIRRWKNNTFESGKFADVDEVLLGILPANWTPASEVIGEAMATIDGFFASDSLLFWRCRELQATGRLMLLGDPGSPRTCELRLEQ